MLRRCLLAALALGIAMPVTGQETAESRRDARRTPVVEVFETSRDAVVNISSTEIVTVRRHGGLDSLFEDLFDWPADRRPRQYTRTSVGSGFVIHPDGYVVTNAHVVARTAERKAIFADGREYEAQVVAIDPARDVAILKIEAEGDLPTLPLGRSNDLMVGETVIAIGNPLGYQHTVTAGVVSAIGRDLEFSEELALEGLIQTDASVNPGNSGGPLLNVFGELIGICTAIRGDAQNIGFAIPVDQLRDVLPDLLDVERRYRLATGLTVSNHDGPRVLEVLAGSAADEAGLKPGDVLQTVDRRPIKAGIDFHVALLGRHAGDRLPLTAQRGPRTFEATLELRPRPLPDGATLARAKLGFDVHPLPDEVARDLGLPRGAGLLVVEVEPGSPASVLGIQRRDILVALGRHYVADVDELGLLLESIDPAEALPVSVLRVDRRGKYKLSGTLRTR